MPETNKIKHTLRSNTLACGALMPSFSSFAWSRTQRKLWLTRHWLSQMHWHQTKTHVYLGSLRRILRFGLLLGIYLIFFFAFWRLLCVHVNIANECEKLAGYLLDVRRMRNERQSRKRTFSGIFFSSDFVGGGCRACCEQTEKLSFTKNRIQIWCSYHLRSVSVCVILYRTIIPTDQIGRINVRDSFCLWSPILLPHTHGTDRVSAKNAQMAGKTWGEFQFHFQSNVSCGWSRVPRVILKQSPHPETKGGYLCKKGIARDWACTCPITRIPGDGLPKKTVAVSE